MPKANRKSTSMSAAVEAFYKEKAAFDMLPELSLVDEERRLRMLYSIEKRISHATIKSKADAIAALDYITNPATADDAIEPMVLRRVTAWLKAA